MVLMFKVHNAAHAHHLVVVLERDEMIQKSLDGEIFYKILHAAVRHEMPQQIVLPPLVVEYPQGKQNIPTRAVNGINGLPKHIFLPIAESFRIGQN